MQETQSTLYVGIDVAKDGLVVALWPRRESWSSSTEPQALKRLAARLKRLVPARIALEATGGWERPVMQALQAAGLPAVLVNPHRVRLFASSLSSGAKTDRIDAFMLAHYASVAPLPPPQPRSDVEQRLRELSTRRRQLTEQLAEEKTRSKELHSPAVTASLRRHIRGLEREIERLDAQIAQVSVQDAELAERLRRLRSVRGIGPVTSVTLATELPELGRGRSAGIAALAGLAPLARDSGKRHGQRHIHGGRRPVRNALYMASLSLVRCHPALRDFYQRLLDRGKPSRVARIAVMRKALLALHAMLRDQSDWCPAGLAG